MEEEFAAMNAPFKERGKVSDEQLTLPQTALDRRAHHVSWQLLQRQRHRLQSQAVSKTAHADLGRRRRQIRSEVAPVNFGDAWFPYFVRITPKELAAGFENVRAEAKKAGRNPDEVQLACCLPVELTPTDGPQITDYLKGSVEQVARDSSSSSTSASSTSGCNS